MKKLIAISILALSSLSAYAQLSTPRVFVTDDPIYEHTGVIKGAANANGAAIAGASHTQSGADPRTVEIQADVVKDCAGVIVTNNPQNADYVLLFRRQGGARSSAFAFGGLAGLALSSAIQKVDGASVFNRDGDLVASVREHSVDKAIKKVCSSFAPVLK
jgi:hypothetical protein